jgi:hypothetical protein
MAVKEFTNLSDFEINREVALALGLTIEVDERFEKERIGDSLMYYDDRRVLHTLYEDYCDNHSLSYPIILENKISVYWNGGVDDTWFARTVHTPRVEHENPLRAALITFLMLNELEQTN